MVKRLYDPKLPQLSGRNYVRAVLEGENCRLKISFKPAACDHVSTVCHMAECIDQWQNDYTLFFDATQGGRWLLERANKDGYQHDKTQNKLHPAHPRGLAS